MLEGLPTRRLVLVLLVHAWSFGYRVCSWREHRLLPGGFLSIHLFVVLRILSLIGPRPVRGSRC